MREEQLRLQLARRVLRLVQLWSSLSGRTCTFQEAREVAQPDVPLPELVAAIERAYAQYKPSTLSYFRRMALDMETEQHKRITKERKTQKGSEGFVSAAELTKPLQEQPQPRAQGQSRRESRPATT
jgi:hypothetical protein